MTAPDVPAIRAALAEAAKSDVLPRAYAYPDDRLTPPCVYVDGPPSASRVAFGRELGLTFQVVAAVGTTWSRAAQEQVDALLVPTWDAIEADASLGGEVQMTVVRSAEPTQPEVGLAGLVFTVEVLP